MMASKAKQDIISSLMDKKNRNTIFLVLMIGVQLIIFGNTSNMFLTPRNLNNVTRQIAEIGMIAIPVAITLITGNVDFSVGSLLGVCAISMGLMIRDMGLPIIVAGTLTILIGALVGAFNGFFVAVLKLPGIVVTTGTQVMLRGVCYILNSGRPVSGFSDDFISISNASLLGIPVSFLIMLIMFVIAIIIMKKTKYGLYVYAVGNNETTSKFSGINSTGIKWLLFALNGAVVGFASIFMLSRLGSAEVAFGTGIDMDVLCSALIGGISILGGSGKLFNVLLGLVTIGFLRNGFNMVGISSIYQQIVLGAMIAGSCVQLKRSKA